MEEPRVLGPAPGPAPSPTLGPGLTTALATSRRRRLLAAIANGVAAALLVIGGAVPLLMLIDGWARAADGWRWLIWGALLVLAQAVFLWRARGAVRLGDDVAVARDLEHRAGLGGALLSAGVSLVQAPPRAASPWMIGRTVALADQAAAALNDWPRLVPLPRAWPAAGATVLLLCAISAAIPAVRPWLVRAWWPGSAVGRPGSLQIEALPGDGALPAGDEPHLSAVVRDTRGELATAAKVAAFIDWSDGRHEEHQLDPLPDSPGLWQLTLPPITCGLTWRVRADHDGNGRWDGESDRRTLSLTAGFLPGEVLIQITPPAYSGVPSDTVGGGDATCLAGSTVTVEATVAPGGPHLVAATVVLETEDGAPPREIPAVVDERTLRAQWTARSTVRWGLRLIAAGGHEELPDRRWRLAVTADLPPAVHLEAVPATLAADAVEAVRMVAEDDVGLADATLEVRRDHGTGELLTHLPLPATNSRQRRAELPLDGAALGLADGDTIALVPVATDRAGQAVRGTPTLVLIAADGSAGWTRLSSHLQAVLAACDASAAALPGLIDGAERSGSDTVARQLVQARISAWSTALVTATQPWPSLPGTDADAASRAAVAELGWWAQRWAEDAASSSGVALAAAPAELAALRRDLAVRATHAAGEAAARAAAAAAEAVTRHARALRGDLAWQNRPANGLSAAFSNDTDNAPVRATAVEVPDFINREVPGIGPSGFRIRYHGLLHVPDGGAELVVTADDGVRLRIAGSERLPAEAWTDHPPIPWRSGTLPAGWLPLELDFRQGAGGSALHLAWGDGRAVTADELRADRAAAGLATTDTTASGARAVALAAAMERLGLPAMTPPWTTEALTHCVTDAQAAAAARAGARTPPPPAPRGTVALAIIMTEVAISRQDLPTALAWLARAAEATDASDANRLKKEMARVAKLGAQADTQTELKQLDQELDRLRQRVPTPAAEVQVAAVPRTAALRQGGERARGDLALAAAALAVELRETAPTATAEAELAETLDRAARNQHPEPDRTLADRASALINQLASGTAAMVADGGLADPARENAARRLEAALERVTNAASRLTRIATRPQDEVPASDPVTLPLPLTKVGRERSRLAPPSLDESGIDGFRPDQQQAIRAYLDRLRRQQRGTP